VEVVGHPNVEIHGAEILTPDFVALLDCSEFIRSEGFGPHRVLVIVECLTDNRNRTAISVRVPWMTARCSTPSRLILTQLVKRWLRTVTSSKMGWKANNLMSLDEAALAEVTAFLQEIDADDDVQEIYTATATAVSGSDSVLRW
jgi:transcriptional/translational regulatory protein YebC/TACO1